MRVLVVQNFHDEGLGQLGRALAEAGAEVDARRPYDGEHLPASADGHDALVVLGGGQNALDDVGSPYFPSLLALMRDFQESGRSVLGICLGSQLLALCMRQHGKELSAACIKALEDAGEVTPEEKVELKRMDE